MRLKFALLISIIISISCVYKIEKVSFIQFEISNDSIHVLAKNNFSCTMFTIVESLNDKTKNYINLNPKSIKKILSFHKKQYDDTLKILNTYNFRLLYGKHNLKGYDSLYNYTLPFLKGKQYRILQGHNTTFTHKGSFSKYAIDFKMNIGQTICAMREGVVIKIIDRFNEGGKSIKYKKQANLIVIAHNDGTFSQYVHLKKNGVLVKVNDTVKKGQVIGFSGNSGMTTEPHLHFAVYKPTKSGLISIPFLLDSNPSKNYIKGKFAKK